MEGLERQQVLEEFERRRKARAITVTVDDNVIRAQLRGLDEPICLFGEGPADRRERLRQLLAKLGEIGPKKHEDEDEDEEQKPDEKNKDTTQTWYHEGQQALKQIRYWIADYSIPRAKSRLAYLRKRQAMNKTMLAAEKQELCKNLRNVEILYSQIGDERPISSCEFSPDDRLIATSSWSSLCKLWDTQTLNCLKTYRGHNANVGAITFHPDATKSQSPAALNLASCSIDGSLHLWSLESQEPISSIKGHDSRVAHVKFHPSGRFLASCCFDNSWRLFDLESQHDEEILYQEGHSKPVYDIDFHPDGSLAATGGLDSYGRVWDLRTGRCIMFMEGHLKGILSVAFASNGYQIITGSEDHTVKIWNLRERNLEYTIAAHSNVVSKVLIDKQNSNFLVTSSYDQTIKFWSAPTWTPIQTLKGHENKIMSIDLSSDNRFLVSSSYDRTFKIWTPDTAKDEPMDTE